MVISDLNWLDSHLVPEHDLLTGGFPCQSWSIAGDKNGLFDETGRLFFEIIRLIRYCKPKALFLENVPNLLMLDMGAHWAEMMKYL